MTTRYFSPSCALSNYSIKQAFVTFTLIALSPFIATAEFGPQRIITGNAGGVIEAASLDLEGDGDLDFFTADLGADQITLHRNNGNGTYSPSAFLEGLNNPGNVHAADLDQDGDLDLVMVGSGNITPFGVFGSELVVARNDGAGNWSIAYTNTNVPGLWDVTTGDLNGDGNLDLVYCLGGSFDQIGWQAGNGRFGFAGVGAISTGAATGDEPRDIHVADVDGDGDLDVLACNYLSNDLSLYRNNGSGISWSRQILESGASGIRKVVTADLNGDGVLDVVRTTVINGQLAYLPGRATGGFGRKRIIHTFPTEPTGGGIFGSDPLGPRGFDVADFDDDGDLDIFSASEVGGQVSLHENTGSGVFSAPTMITNAASGVNFIKVVDVDGDEDLDVVAVSPTTNRVTWYEQLGSGNTEPFALLGVDIDDQRIRVSWPTNQGLRYQVQRSTDLSRWLNVGTSRTGTGNPMTYLYPLNAASPRKQFYRVVIR